MGNAKQDRPSEEEMWAGPSGERWLGSALRLEKTLEGIGEELLVRAKLNAGERVVDVGCGAGGMSLEIARRVGPGGSVTGLDISPALIKEATRRVAAGGLNVPVKFMLGDAAKVELDRKADCLISRFGIMFFSDPYAAFVHLRHLIKPGGSLALRAGSRSRRTHGCWRCGIPWRLILNCRRCPRGCRGLLLLKSRIMCGIF